MTKLPMIEGDSKMITLTWRRIVPSCATGKNRRDRTYIESVVYADPPPEPSRIDCQSDLNIAFGESADLRQITVIGNESTDYDLRPPASPLWQMMCDLRPGLSHKFTR